MTLSDSQIESVLEWIDSVPLSRPKRNIARDFSDGLMVAEVISHFAPRIIEIHNYTASNSTSQKRYTWQTLSQKVLSPRLDIRLDDSQIEAFCTAKQGAIEPFLLLLKSRVQEFLASEARKRQQKATTRPEVQPQEDPRPPPATQAAPVVQSAQSAQATVEQLSLILAKKDEAIAELVAQVSALQRRISHLEELCAIKDQKIARLQEQHR